MIQVPEAMDTRMLSDDKDVSPYIPKFSVKTVSSVTDASDRYEEYHVLPRAVQLVQG